MEERILVVDDAPINRRILEELLDEHYELAFAADGEECLLKVREFEPELVLLDIMMPGIDGYEVCRRIKDSPIGAFTQVIFVSGKTSTAERMEGYEAGADDYIVKPFDHDELLAKVRIHFRLRESQIEVRKANLRLQEFNSDLERLAAERSRQIIATRDVTIFTLAKLAESRDPETGEHLERMSTYSRILADELNGRGPYSGQMDDAFVDQIYRASPLHDIGKVGIPDAILLKPGAFDPREWEIMKRHTTIGAEALEQAVQGNPNAAFLGLAAAVARHHHEWFNGSGYPDGLAGTDIPLCARIVALADVFDALTSRRVYKPALSPEESRRIIEKERGEHFDPVVVDAFLARYDEFVEVFHTVLDRELVPRTAEA